MTAEQLIGWANLPNQEVKLSLPKFKIEPPTLPLGEALQALGMTTAFDKPRGSANFDRMAPRRPPNDYLYISRVFHKTFMSVDEKGTEGGCNRCGQVAMVYKERHHAPAKADRSKSGSPLPLRDSTS